ncbi:MAG TPA: hypothetical protein VKZ67_00965 [Natronosporangium sp.]|nr:hypothetical protein [Natronosporangium sp.]
MPETTTGPARIAAQPPAAPSPTPGTPETDPADLDAIAARNAHRRCHHCDMPLDDDQRCPNCGSETPDDVGALVAEVRRLRHAQELDRADLERVAAERDEALAEQNAMQARLAELARQRDAARRDGAADALAYAAQWIRKVFTGIDPEIGRVLDAMEYSVRSGFRTIPTGGGDQP